MNRIQVEQPPAIRFRSIEGVHYFPGSSEERESMQRRITRLEELNRQAYREVDRLRERESELLIELQAKEQRNEELESIIGDIEARRATIV